MNNQFVLKRVAITEKASRLSALNQFVFLVDSAANKPEIRKAVETKYRVHVSAVQTTTQKSKVKRFGYKFNARPRFKKAVVTLKAGETIPLE